MTLIDPDVVNAKLVPALVTADVEAIYAFLAEHAVDYQSTAQVFQTVPRLVATLLENHPAAPTPGPGEFWAMEALGPSSQIHRVNAQLIVAALNRNDERISDLVRSVLTWPAEAVERLLAQLMLSFMQIVREWPKPHDVGSDHG